MHRTRAYAARADICEINMLRKYVHTQAVN